jgi:hypothetical protein
LFDLQQVVDIETEKRKSAALLFSLKQRVSSSETLRACITFTSHFEEVKEKTVKQCPRKSPLENSAIGK